MDRGGCLPAAVRTTFYDKINMHGSCWPLPLAVRTRVGWYGHPCAWPLRTGCCALYQFTSIMKPAYAHA
eukprot:594566-Pleurochrysis_carterae.AAC.2